MLTCCLEDVDSPEYDNALSRGGRLLMKFYDRGVRAEP